MCSQNAGNAISETQILKISWGGMPPDPLAILCLRYSAHTFGDRILSWGKWALWQFGSPTTEESLKNALHFYAKYYGTDLCEDTVTMLSLISFSALRLVEFPEI
jgi:hypothetical protein